MHRRKLHDEEKKGFIPGPPWGARSKPAWKELDLAALGLLVKMRSYWNGATADFKFAYSDAPMCSKREFIRLVFLLLRLGFIERTDSGGVNNNFVNWDADLPEGRYRAARYRISFKWTRYDPAKPGLFILESPHLPGSWKRCFLPDGSWAPGVDPKLAPGRKRELSPGVARTTNKREATEGSAAENKRPDSTGDSAKSASVPTGDSDDSTQNSIGLNRRPLAEISESQPETHLYIYQPPGATGDGDGGLFMKERERSQEPNQTHVSMTEHHPITTDDAAITPTASTSHESTIPPERNELDELTVEEFDLDWVREIENPPDLPPLLDNPIMEYEEDRPYDANTDHTIVGPHFALILAVVYDELAKLNGRRPATPHQVAIMQPIDVQALAEALKPDRELVFGLERIKALMAAGEPPESAPPTTEEEYRRQAAERARKAREIFPDMTPL